MAGTKSDQNITATMSRALELTEEALSQIARIAIEQIHSGVESSSHVEAAERDMRSALRQLVLAERDLRSRSRARAGVAERPDRIAKVVLGQNSEASPRGG